MGVISAQKNCRVLFVTAQAGRRWEKVANKRFTDEHSQDAKRV